MSLRGVLRASVFRYTGVAVLALSLGSASVVLAAGTGAMQLPSFRIADATDPERLAKVDAAGNLQVSVNNTPSTQQVSGTVSVSNFPATQQVSGTVSVTAPSGRVILLATNFNAPASNPNGTADVDTSDCRSLVGMIRGPFSSTDVTVRLYQMNPDGSGFGSVNGTRAGIMTYFTVNGTPIVTPRAGITVQSNLDDPLIIEKIWLFCAH
jgi:hypothetical protein